MPVDLGIYGPDSTQGKKSTSIMSNIREDMLGQMMAHEIATFDGSQNINFESIVRKYPHLSKDVIVGLVKAGANADTPGISKVASVDSISQVMRNATYVDKIPSLAQQDKSFLSQIKDAPYALLKGTTRVGFAALRSPYDFITTAARDVYAMKQGEKGAGMQFIQDINPVNLLAGKTSAFGTLTRDVLGGKPGVDTGSGFFISPESRVGKQQAKAMQSMGLVNGQSFTLGRGSLATVGADPNSTAYKLASGTIDAVFNVMLDPSTYVGVGALAKVGVLGASKGGAKLAGAKKISQLEAEADFAKEVARLNKQTKITKTEQKLIDEVTDAEGNIKRAVQNTLGKANEDYLNSQKYLEDAQELASSKKSDAIIDAVDPEKVKNVKALEDQSLFGYVEDIIIQGRQDELIDTLSTASATSKNASKAFPGAFIVEELPSKGKVIPGVHGNDEFLLSLAKEGDLKVVDLAQDYSKLTKQEAEVEMILRGKLSDEIKYVLSDTSIPKATRDALAKIDNSEFFDNIAFGDGSMNLADVIAGVGFTAGKRNEHAVGLLTNMIEDLWKADAFSNVRRIQNTNAMGGIAIVSKGSVVAKGIKISETLADSKTMGIYNVPKSLVEAQASIDASKAALETAKKAKRETDKALKEIKALRDFTSMDPELVAKIVNNPDYAPLKDLMDLELKVGQKMAVKEYLRAEAGLVKDGMGGPVATDLAKVNQFLLGKRFAVVADIVAKQTSASKIARLFNNKMDLSLAGDLAKAETADDVLKILRTHLADPVTDPQLARSLALRSQTAAVATPIIKTVLQPNSRAIQAVEKMETYLSRVYIRSTILPLDDLDRLGTGLREWMQSAEVPVSMIDDTIDELIGATAKTDRNVNVIRAQIIDKALKKSHEAIVAKHAPGNQELLDILQNEIKIAGKTEGLIKNYAVSLHANGKLPFIAMADGTKITTDGAVYAYQFLDDVVRLPSTKPIVKAIRKYDKSGPLIGKRAAQNVLQTELGEHWRTAQLAFRVSYVLRNIGEMQVRQYLSGHDTMLNHPLSYMAMMMANPNGKAFQKWLTHIEKYGNDVMGNNFKDPEGAKLFTQAVDEHLQLVSRSISAADPRSADPVTRVLGKIYRVVESDHPEFYVGYSNTLGRFALDDIMQLVAKADTPQLQSKLVNDLIKNKPIMINNKQRTNIIEELLAGANVGKEAGTPSAFDKIFLIKPEEKFSYQNINIEGVQRWLFDGESTASYQHALGNLMGGGEKGIYIRKLLADGSVDVPTGNGTFKTITMPRYRNAESFEDGGKKIQSFKSQLEELFPRDEMPNAQALFADTKTWTKEAAPMLKQGIDTFFQWATKIESVANFGPEYRMSYWDHIGRYAPALGMDDLLRAKSIAEKTLSPIRTKTPVGRYVTIGKRHQTLRIIRQEIKKREKNADFKAPMTLEDAHATAARLAGQSTRELFYDASRTLDATNKARLLFPFLQAHMNTIKSWGTLTAKNPIQVYKFGKAFDALTKPGTSAIYDVTSTKYDENDGFFYKDEFGTTRFRYPLLGNILGAFAGKSIDSAQALQLTAPVESLNLAFGSTNPLMPGVGPVAQSLFLASGKSGAFGPGWDFARDWVFPFGPPKDPTDIVMPAWLKKTLWLGLNDQELVEKGIKGWAGYLASTGKYGDNPLANDVTREAMFDEARGLSRWIAAGTAIFQSILPATPTQEVMNKIKTPEGKFQFQINTILYQAWKDTLTSNAGDYDRSILEFADRFGDENLLTIISGSTKSVTGTEDAWSFLNDNPDVVSKFATRDADIIPYLFPGGEAAMSYYNWQRQTSRRTPLNREDISNAAENLIYSLEKSRISNQQINEGHSDIWYTEQVIALNTKYGGRPVSDVSTGRAQARADNVGLALREPAFQKSPVYAEAVEFYAAYDNAVRTLQDNRVTPEPDLGSTYWANTLKREELQQLGTKLMLQNPSFSRLYYSVFAPLMKA
jgi:hypothetical protein